MTDDELRSRSLIRDALGRYARAIDRNQLALLRTVFHPDAQNDHGSYKGGVDGFIRWLEERFADDRPTQHFLGNSQFEFAGPDIALVETYYIAARPPKGAEAAEGSGLYVLTWGRYIDRFERRGGEWRVASRCMVVDLRLNAPLAGMPASDPSKRGRRDASDPLHVARADMVGRT